MISCLSNSESFLLKTDSGLQNVRFSPRKKTFENLLWCYHFQEVIKSVSHFALSHDTWLSAVFVQLKHDSI